LLRSSIRSGVYGHFAYRDKKVVGVFVRFFVRLQCAAVFISHEILRDFV
jgi:hypothetical protein